MQIVGHLSASTFCVASNSISEHMAIKSRTRLPLALAVCRIPVTDDVVIADVIALTQAVAGVHQRRPLPFGHVTMRVAAERGAVTNAADPYAVAIVAAGMGAGLRIIATLLDLAVQAWLVLAAARPLAVENDLVVANPRPAALFVPAVDGNPVTPRRGGLVNNDLADAPHLNT